jgi:hypothetical protein
MPAQFYENLLAKKRAWSPVEPVYSPVVDGAEDVIARALALRVLEIPVGEFITEATQRDLPPGARPLLESNVLDEERHDRALELVAQSFGDRLPDYSVEAQRIRQAWLDEDAHPVLKALVLERSLFFVVLPLFRFLGNSGLRTTSSDISRDEVIHTGGHSAVCAELGVGLTKRLDAMRKATAAWMLEGLDIRDERIGQYGDRNFWLRQSDRLLYEGRAPELVETKRARMPAFFEMDARDLPAYA